MTTRIGRNLATVAARATQKGTRHPGNQSAPSRSHDKIIQQLLRPVAKPPPRSEEERKNLRIMMKRYGRLKSLQHTEMQNREREFVRAKWAAVDALPHFRRVEALETKPEEFPFKPLPTHTPPIKGFDSGDISKN